MVYSELMFNGLRIYSSDTIWRQILTDLGATVLDAPATTAINLDELNLDTPVTLVGLKAAILAALDDTKITTELLGPGANLPLLHQQIIVALYKSGGMSMPQLKDILGYSPDVATHAVDTAIYQIRKNHGHEFIVNENGVYKIGHI